MATDGHSKKVRRIGGFVLGFILFANIPWVLLVATGEPITEDNRYWMYGMLILAAIPAGLIVAVRGVVRKVRERSPALPSEVVASSTAVGFGLITLVQISHIQPNRPEVAAAFQSLIVAIAAAIWWGRARRT